jgi:nucleotide-binding universal stress UspA family protein
MKIKQILVALTGEADSSQVPALAFEIARESGAHVIGTDTVTDAGPFIDQAGIGMMPSYYADLYKTAEKVQHQKRSNAAATFETARKSAGIPLVDRPGLAAGATAEWLSGEAYNGATVSSLGRLCDLIVLNHPGEKSSYGDQQAFQAAVFTTRRPVMLVPPQCQSIGDHAAIAWNGSAEACAAVEGSLPLLEGMRSIDIIQVGDLKPGAASAWSLQNYLGWHGIASRLLTAPDQTGKTTTVITDLAKTNRATFLVMGAYSHSALREFILGGVTESMITHSQIPIIMAH